MGPGQAAMPRPERERCPTCGTPKHARQNQPMTDDPEVLDGVLEALQGRLDDLKARRVNPKLVHRDLADLCSGCHDVLRGVSARADREELIQHFALAIRRIDARLQAMEQDHSPSAEQSARLSGPGDDIA
jgi:hypothetical protein